MTQDTSNAAAETPDKEPSPPRPRARRWVLALAVVGVLVCLVVAAWLARGKIAQMLVDALAAEIRGRGEPLDWKDFAEPPVPADQNAAPLYEKAAKGFLKEGPGLSSEQVDQIERPIHDLVMNRQFRRSHRAEVKKVLDLSRESLALLREGHARPGVDWGLDFSRPATEGRFPEIWRSIDLSRAAALAALEAHDAGDDEEAVQRLAEAMALGRAIGRFPGGFSIQYRMACQQAVISAIEQILPTLRIGKPPFASPQQARDLMAELLDTDSMQSQRVRGQMADRCVAFEIVHRLGKGENPIHAEMKKAWLRPEVLSSECLQILRVFAVNIDVAKEKTYPAAMAKREQCPDNFEALREEGGLSDRHPILWLLHSGFDMMEGVHLPSSFGVFARSRMAGTALAMRLYEVERGKGPATLEDLVAGGILARVPEDPFSGAGGKIQYKADPQQPRLYSVGEDGRDDGGKFTLDDKGGAHDAPDLVYFLNGNRPQAKPATRP